MILRILYNYHQWDLMQVYPNISEFSKWMFISFKWFLENNHPFGTDWIAGNKIAVRQSHEQVFLCPLLFSTLSGLTSTIHTSRYCWLWLLQSCIWWACSFRLIFRSIGCLHSELLKNRLLCVHIISIPVFIGGDRHTVKLLLLNIVWRRGGESLQWKTRWEGDRRK